jgi:hypothetical protein
MMFNFASTLRGLTAGSPITTALREARRMARAHMKKGGVAVPAKAQSRPAGFVVPPDIDAAALGMAIEEKLRVRGNVRSERSSGLLKLLERTPDGQVVVPQVVLERLGDGAVERGERFVKRIIIEIRNRKV